MSADPSTAAVPGLELSCDKSRLDLDWIFDRLKNSYWGAWLNDAQVRVAVWNSLNFGAYIGQKQVGYIRVVGDGAIFSSVCDVWVDEEWRGKGIGTALLKATVEHPAVKSTVCILKARPEAWLWYFRSGDFHIVDRKTGIMQRQPR